MPRRGCCLRAAITLQPFRSIYYNFTLDVPYYSLYTRLRSIMISWLMPCVPSAGARGHGYVAGASLALVLWPPARAGRALRAMPRGPSRTPRLFPTPDIASWMTVKLFGVAQGRGLTMTRTVIAWLMVFFGMATFVCGRAGWGQAIEPLVQVSDTSPFGPLEECGNFPGVVAGTGINFLNSEIEPWVDVNPTNPQNITALWQQDRWSNGGARSNVAGVSFDGGTTWQIVVVPGLTDCSGGSFERASDPWLAFAPDGTLHHISLLLNVDPPPAFPIGFGPNALAVSKSTDGGLTWSAPSLIIADDDPHFLNDKQSITADPADAHLVYAVWDRLALSPNGINFRGPSYLARTRMGGTPGSLPGRSSTRG
jgi:hypothetical protein